MTQLYIQPYNQDNQGFFINSYEEFEEKIKAADFEEYELQFIEGDDSQLFNALSIDGTTLERWYNEIEDLDEYEKAQLFYMAGYNITNFTQDTDIESIIQDCDICQMDSMEELAEQFVDEGLYGDIPNTLVDYIDYEKIARDLSYDYERIIFNDTSYIVRAD